METPTSSRRVTRSQTLASKGTRTINGKQQQERSALIDITNDSSPSIGLAMETPSSAVGKQKSNNGGAKNLMMTPGSPLIDIINDSSPIIGLAMETPSSAAGKQRSNNRGAKNLMMTPGSGEALLRGQVRTLLQRVEEEAVVSKLQFANRPFIHLQSPMGLVAPANTPQFPNLCEDGIGGIKDVPVVEEQLNVYEVVSGNLDGNFVITRSLLMDFAEKSDEGVVLKEEKSATKVKKLRSQDVEDYEEEDDGGLADELCKGISKISITEMFTGKHTRFICNSDGEIEGEENIIRLKGNHLRFPLKEEQDQ